MCLINISTNSNSWQSALQTISSQANANMIQQQQQNNNQKSADQTPQLLADLHTRWSNTEIGLREKIQQLETMVSDNTRVYTLLILTIVLSCLSKFNHVLLYLSKSIRIKS